jgi:predicted metal-dependent peptidase
MDKDLQKEIVRQAIKDAHEEASKRRGHIPGNIASQIKKWMKKPEIPWQSLLKQYVGRSVKAEYKYSWKRQSRRFGGAYKGQIPQRILKLGLAIDTSGSVGTNEFNEFIAEIRGIQKCYKSEITVMECDADVQKIYKLKPYMKVDTKFAGRGGTDFDPVFKKIKEEVKYKPDLLIYFTDLWCDYPKERPSYQVLWVCTSDGNHSNKPPWGGLVHIKKKKNQSQQDECDEDYDTDDDDE